MNCMCHQVTPSMVRKIELEAFPMGLDTITRIYLLDGTSRFATLSPEALDVLISELAVNKVFKNVEMCGGDFIFGNSFCFELAKKSRVCACGTDSLTAEILLSIIFADKC